MQLPSTRYLSNQGRYRVTVPRLVVVLWNGRMLKSKILGEDGIGRRYCANPNLPLID